MAKRPSEDPRLARLTKISLTFPETVRQVHGKHAAFLARKKTFAYFLDDHHGDGIVSICCKSTLARQGELVGRHPDRYYVPAYVGPRGWVALRLDLRKVDWKEVADLVFAAYRMQAPRGLAEQFE